MRTITIRPDISVPDLVESDIDNNLIIGSIYRPSTQENRIVYAVKYYNPRKTYNWYGTDYLVTPNSRFYKWNIINQKNLLDHITQSWKYWNNVLKIYICECLDDISITLNELRIPGNTFVHEQLIDQFELIRSGSNYYDCH